MFVTALYSVEIALVLSGVGLYVANVVSRFGVHTFFKARKLLFIADILW